MGIVSGITGVFAATQQKRAAEEAMRILAEAQNMAFNEAGQLKTTFDPILKSAMEKLGVSWDTIQGLITDAKNIDVGDPLNASDKIAMQDAQRIMNENLAKTGNLRSGASAFANEELTRRVLADAMTRNFDRTMQKENLLFGGANLLTGVANTEANVGMQGYGLAEQMFSTGLSFSPMRAQAEMQKGAANANAIMSVGQLGDSVLSTGAMAYAGGAGLLPGGGGAMGGAAMGLNPQLSSMMMMSQFFKGMAPTAPTSRSSASDYFG